MHWNTYVFVVEQFVAEKLGDGAENNSIPPQTFFGLLTNFSEVMIMEPKSDTPQAISIWELMLLNLS